MLPTSRWSQCPVSPASFAACAVCFSLRAMFRVCHDLPSVLGFGCSFLRDSRAFGAVVVAMFFSFSSSSQAARAGPVSRHNGSERASGEDSERITSTRGANKRVVKVLAAGNMQRGLPSDFGLFTEKTEGFAILMLMPKHSSHVLDLAKRGAAIRLGELADEAKLLLGLFPHLRDSFDRDEMPISFLGNCSGVCTN